jgi:hypothetical protein
MLAALLAWLVLVSGTPINDVNPSAQPRSPYGRPCGAKGAPTKEWSRPLTSVYSVGVTPVQDTLMWVSAGQTELKIYVYNIKDPARPLVDSFDQTSGPTGWGIRDMAWKASTDEVYGGFDNRQFNVYDATSHAVKHSYVVSGYDGVVRGFGYSPYQDSCWTCDFDTAPMTKFSINGSNGHSVKPAREMASSYGIAFDAHQHCFWVTQAGAVGASPTLKLDYSYNAVDSFNADGWEQGGGCEMWRDTFLLQLNQATPDEVFCMRFSLSPLLNHDVGVSAIASPPASVNPGSFAPRARVMNFGANPESDVPVTCGIDSAGIRVYSSTATLAGPLGPGLEAEVTFVPNWNSGPVGAQYTATMFTDLPGDEDTRDDTLTRATTVTGAVFADTIHVRPASPAPTIDGYVDMNEWSASTAYDISDIAGRAGTPQPAGSCIGYFLYDSGYAYLALDCPNRTTRVNLDQFGPYVDENNNRVWSADSSEGGYAIEYVDTGDQVVFRALLDTLGTMWEMGTFADSLSASSLASGHLQFEAKLPLGALKYQLNVGSGDTAGCFLYAAVDGLSDYIGWWPQSVTVSEWPNPRYYGVLIFDSLPSGVAGRVPGVPFALYRASPSHVLDRAAITYCVSRPADVRLVVCDVTGSLVRTLVRGRVAPGEHTVVWDRTDEAGRRAASGTYFYHLVVDGTAISGKAVLLR